MRVLITRPEEDARGLAEKLSAMGIESRIEPLMTITDTGEAPSLSGVAALLFTSANGVRAFARASDVRDVSVLAVGDATARAAQTAGFAGVETAGGDVHALAALVKKTRNPADGALLHVAGTQVAGDLAGLLSDAGFTCHRAVLYEAQAATGLSAETASALADGVFAGVLFYSPRTASLFADLVGGEVGALAKMTAYCLSDAVAEKASALGWGRVAVASTPDETALLEILAKDAVA